MKTKTILITGSEGKVGSVLTEGLLGHYDVWTLDMQDVQRDQHVVADVSDMDALKSAFQKLPSLDGVIHLAANPHPDAIWGEILQSNIIGTRNFYECAREFKVPRVVFASSNRTMFMYEADNPKLVKPTDPVRPGSDYGVSKVFGEALARYYYDKFGIESICIRIGSLIHPDDPTTDPRHRKTWLSHADAVQLFHKSLEAGVPFGIYFGVSDNKDRFWDIANAEKDLGYKPQDDASKL